MNAAEQPTQQLLNENKNPAEIICAKLFGTVDVIGVVSSAVRGHIFISHVHSVTLAAGDEGKTMVNINPFFTFSAAGVAEQLDLNLDNASVYQPVDGLKDEFIKILTRIALANQAQAPAQDPSTPPEATLDQPEYPQTTH